MPATVLDFEDTLVRSGHHFLSVGLPCWQKEIIQLHKLFRVVEGEKAGLKLNIQKMKNTASSPITAWQIDGETVEIVADSIWAPKSLQMVTEAMKLKDACSLEEKL